MTLNDQPAQQFGQRINQLINGMDGDNEYNS